MEEALASTTMTTTSAPVTTTTSTTATQPSTTTNRYKPLLRALGILTSILTTKSLPMLKTSNTTTTTTSSTHAGFLSHRSLVATTTPVAATSSTALTPMPLRNPNSHLDDHPVPAARVISEFSSNGNHIRSFLNNFLTTHNRINNRSNYNSKRMFHSEAISSSGVRANATTKAMAMSILRALWDDYSHANQTKGNGPKYVPIALTAPSSSASTAKSIIIESSKNKILPYPPSNLITIHNFHPSVDELRPVKVPATQHLFHPSDYDNWDEINQSSSQQQEQEEDSLSEEIMSKLPLSIKRTPMISSTVTVRPMKVKNQVQPLRVNVISSQEEKDNGIIQVTGSQVGNYNAANDEEQNSVSVDAPSNKPKKQKNQKRKKTIKNKPKKTPSSTTSSMIVVAEEEYGLDDDPVDPDLETQQPEIDQESAITQTDNNAQEETAEQHLLYEAEDEEGQEQDQEEIVKSEYCPRSNKFSANRDDRCVRKGVKNKKRPKQKFDVEDLENEKAHDDDPDVSRHGVKIKPPKIPKIKVPKIKVPKIKPPKTKLSLKHMPTMMAVMKTFFTGVSMATMYNPFNFGLWSVVLHPVTMLLIGLGGVVMYCFPWTSVALLTSRKHSGNTIEVHRYGRRAGSRPGRIVRYDSPPARSDWLEDHAGWILGVINNYTFQTEL